MLYRKMRPIKQKSSEGCAVRGKGISLSGPLMRGDYVKRNLCSFIYLNEFQLSFSGQKYYNCSAANGRTCQRICWLWQKTGREEREKIHEYRQKTDNLGTAEKVYG